MRTLTALLLSIVFIAPLAAAQEAPEYVPNVVVVQFTPDAVITDKSNRVGLRDFDLRAAQYGVHLIERMYPFLDYMEPTPKTRRILMALRRTYYVRFQANTVPKAVAADLAAVPGVVYAEPVAVMRTLISGPWISADPNDPMYSQQSELKLLRLPEAWDVIKSENGAPRTVIAIVDGGGEWRHEDLRANVWTNPNEIAGNGVDDDGNGFIDDVHGVNFANGDDTDNDPTGLPGTPGNAQHGTAAAGSASAVTDNNVGVAGAAWNADLMHINAGCSIERYICYGYSGILYAAANGADIINASWGGLVGEGGARYLDETLNLVTDMGALVVSSAGNDNRSHDHFRYYPARSPRVLSVGATGKDTRRRAGFSNYGRLVNVFAPGVGIVTTGSDNSYISVSGTSFSSPLTAGVAALVKTRFPNLTADGLREHIRLSSDNMDAENPGFEGQLGTGFVNALAALQSPALPAVRVKRWSWVDDDGDLQIASGDVVTVTATVVNYLEDASQLKVGLVGAEPYSFIDIAAAANIGSLASGDSAEIQLEFTVAADAPANQRVRLFARVSDGAHEDRADQLTFRVNRSLEAIHQGLSALYMATGGDQWTQNDNWDITRVPSEGELSTWFGVVLNEGWLFSLRLADNNLTGMLPPELGNLQALQYLSLEDNSVTGTLPRSLMQLTNLVYFNFGGQQLCAPPDNEFQVWLNGIRHRSGPTCEFFAGDIADQSFTKAQSIAPLVLPEATGGVAPINYSLTPTLLTGLNFDVATRTVSGTPTEITANPVPYTYKATDAIGSSDSLHFHIEVHGPVTFSVTIVDQSFPRGQRITPLVLPRAAGGSVPLTYTLTPALPAGLDFSGSSLRTITGTPTEVTANPVPYTYKATDAIGSSDSLHFHIEVYSPVNAERETLPQSFVVHGNYPNPFRHSTRLLFDLPWPARVKVDVVDVTGQRVLAMPSVDLAAGWKRHIEVRGSMLPSGMYLYRLIATSPEGITAHSGHFIRLR